MEAGMWLALGMGAPHPLGATADERAIPGRGRFVNSGADRLH